MAWMWWGVECGLALLVAGQVAQALASTWDARRNPAPGQLVDIGGRRLHVLCKGPPVGPTVVIEQGAGSPSILWWPLVERIAGFARVCAYDRAGYQWSDPAPRRRSLQDRVDDLHQALAGAAVPGPFVMVAHSFGGPLVRLYAATYPDEVAGMVLVDTPEESVIFRPAYQAYCNRISTVARVVELAAWFGIVRLGLILWRRVPDGFTPASFFSLKAFLARPGFYRAMADDPAALARVQADMRRPGGFGASLGDRPLVVLRHGLKFPGPAASLEEGWEAGQERLARLSTRGELIVAANSNHMIQADEPDLVVDAIERVVAAVRASGASQTLAVIAGGLESAS
jgi:pimeloyl-ACP methyl ester carboxylesterase